MRGTHKEIENMFFSYFTTDIGSLLYFYYYYLLNEYKVLKKYSHFINVKNTIARINIKSTINT